MDEIRSKEDRPRERTASRKWLTWAGLIALAFLLGFLLGFVPMWRSKNNVSAELDHTRVELQQRQQVNALAAAAIYARRGEYETARQYASQFFTDVQAELDYGESKILNAQERAQMPQLMANRDEIITLLSRADPASAERLSNLYVEFRAVTD